MTGSACAYNGDCCNGEPCVPDQNGQLHCGASCVNTNGLCTQTADCCSGETCVFMAGQTFGTCGGGTGSGSGSGSGTCALDGQMCTATGDCCNQGLQHRQLERRGRPVHNGGWRAAPASCRCSSYFENASVTLLMVPTSCAAVSATLSVQVPLTLAPSSAAVSVVKQTSTPTR